MNTLGAVLGAYGAASGRDAALFEWRSADQAPRLLAATDVSRAADMLPPGASSDEVLPWARTNGYRAVSVGSNMLPTWLVMAPSLVGNLTAIEAHDADAIDAFVSDVVPHVRRLVRERDGATHELAERYEEISLLYAIGELLGSGASVESVAFTVLRELAQTVGAPRGALMLHDPLRDVLVPAALLGIAPSETTIVSANDEHLLAVRAFRSGETFVEEGGAPSRSGAPLLASDGGPVLAVPIRRTSASGTMSLGSVLLAGRVGDPPFSAGDRKLVTAIASQVGTALHNARLVRAALEQEQLAREMRLAHELQLKLLPNPSVVGPEARAAARVVPAESVGGDFYLLARLAADRTGVVIGDVSGHGYQAALVMALAISAAAIHVQAVIDPGVALDAVRRSLIDELESTEMSITLFYGVIDEDSRVLRFANAGHPHAFVLRSNGETERLAALVPPLGFCGDIPASQEVAWNVGDRLLLFTDGVADARNAQGERFGEAAVLNAALQSDPNPERVLASVFDAVHEFVGVTPLIDDLAVVVLDRVGVHAESVSIPSLELRSMQRAPA
jgi:sigma-B regulation protein RsbU (phosphoserine phosphatase)